MTVLTPAPAAPTFARPGLGRLTGVEFRKMVDTRSGFWLLGIIGLLTLLVVGVVAWFAEPADRDLQGLFGLAILPGTVLLPVLGILIVTAEWSQRTALTTFTLVPQRSRVAVAKLIAATAAALACTALCLLLAVLGNLAVLGLDRGGGSWQLGWDEVARAALFLVLNVLTGVGFGMVLLNSPLAIVLYFVLPIVFSTVTSLFSRIRESVSWVDANAQLEALVSGDPSAGQWWRLLTSCLIWVGLPIAAGLVRLVRSEVK